MKESNSLLKVSGKRLKLLAETINTIRPGSHIDVDELNSMTPEARRVKIASILAVRGFKEEELRRIKRIVFKIDVPYKLIATWLIIGVLAFVSYRVYQFFKLPRVFAIGNDIPVTSAVDNSGRVVKRLDLFGKSNTGKSTASTMILVKDTGEYYVVQNNDLIDWFMGNAKNFYVNMKPVVTQKAEYDEYARIFEQAKGVADFDQLTAEDRIAIKTCIDNNKVLFKAVVEVNKGLIDAYKPFITANGIDNQRYLFLCLKKQNDQSYNVQVTCQNGVFGSYKEIASNVGKTFSAPLQWKAEAGLQFPIVSFSTTSPKETYQSLFPPYATFIK